MTVQLANCKHGRFLVMDNDYWIGRLLLRNGLYSEPEVELLTSLISKDDIIVEAGSNIGAITIPLAKKAKHILAFEPQKLLYKLLCANLALNDCENVDAYPVAVGENSSDELYLPKIDYSVLSNFGGVGVRHSWDGLEQCGVALERGERVAVFTIDDLRLDNVKLIKADVEGMEFSVIKGATKTIERSRPLLYLEDEETGNKELYSFLEQKGYKVHQHMIPLVGPDDDFNQHKGATIVSKNILCIPNEQL